MEPTIFKKVEAQIFDIARNILRKFEAENGKKLRNKNLKFSLI